MRKLPFPFRVQNEHLFTLALAAITAVAAVAVGPKSTVLAIFFWLLTIVLTIGAFSWDYVRWQFLSPKIREQIRKGFALHSNLDVKRIPEWDTETLSAIDERYGKSSFQYRCFCDLSVSKYPDPLILLEWKLDCLKGLATTWFGPAQFKQ